MLASGVTVATREAGLKVALLEPDLLGGTCPNRGCMPKKVLVAAAHALDEIERAKAHKIAVGKPSLDWGALIDREKAMIAGIPASLEGLMNRRGVEVIRDRGRFVGPNAVAVGGETLEAKHIVIATGSTPRRLPFPGAELMITSDDVLSERRLPESVVFVGGGVIALEFSHVYARAGAKVTILEVLPQLLTNMDADAVEHAAPRDRAHRGCDPYRGRGSPDRARRGTAPRRLFGKWVGARGRGRARRQRRRAGRQCRRPRPRPPVKSRRSAERIALDAHLRSIVEPGGLCLR